MSSVEELREYAWGVNRFLVGAEGRHGAKQAIESGKEENSKLPGLTEDLKIKLAAASAAASALLNAAGVTAALFIQGKEDTGRARELSGYFDSENAAGLRAAVVSSETATGAIADLSEMTAQELNEKLSPLFKVCRDLEGIVPPGVTEGRVDEAGAAIAQAHQEMTEYERHLG